MVLSSKLDPTPKTFRKFWLLVKRVYLSQDSTTPNKQHENCIEQTVGIPHMPSRPSMFPCQNTGNSIWREYTSQTTPCSDLNSRCKIQFCIPINVTNLKLMSTHRELMKAEQDSKQAVLRRGTHRELATLQDRVPGSGAGGGHDVATVQHLLDGFLLVQQPRHSQEPSAKIRRCVSG